MDSYWDGVYDKLRSNYYDAMRYVDDPKIDNMVHFKCSLENFPPRIDIEFGFSANHHLKAENYEFGIPLDENIPEETLIDMGVYVAKVLKYFPDCRCKRGKRYGLHEYCIRPKDYRNYAKQ